MITDIDFRAGRIKWRIRAFADRAGLPFRYLTRRCTEGDGMTLLYEAERLSKHYALVSISAESVFEDALNRYEPHPSLRQLCDEAADRVGSKWEDDGHTTGAAIDWALNLVAEYARTQGIDLVDVNEDAEDAAA